MSTRIEYICLDCGHTWLRRKADEDLSKTRRQCAKCWSDLVYPVETYNRILVKVSRGNPVPYERIDALINILAQEGITLRPIRTLFLVRKVLEDLRK